MAYLFVLCIPASIGMTDTCSHKIALHLINIFVAQLAMIYARFLSSCYCRCQYYKIKKIRLTACLLVVCRLIVCTYTTFSSS